MFRNVFFAASLAQTQKKVLLLAEIAETLQHICIRATWAFLVQLVLQKFRAVTLLMFVTHST